MPHLAVLIAAALMAPGFAAGFFFLRRKLLYHRAARWAVFFIALIAAGLLLHFSQMNRLAATFAQKTWPTVQGVVTEARVAETRDARPIVRFEYSINGAAFRGVTDLHLPGFGGRNNRRDAALEVILPFTRGDSVRVYYDPQNPAHALLKPGPTWDIFAKLGLAGVLILCGSIFLASVVVRGKANPER